MQFSGCCKERPLTHKMCLLAMVLVVLLTVLFFILGADVSSASVTHFLEDYNHQMLTLSNAAALGWWLHSTNVTEYNQNISLTKQANLDLFNSKAYFTAKKFIEAHKKGDLNLTDDALRQLQKVGQAALKGPERERLNSVMGNISLIFTHAELGEERDGEGNIHLTDGCQGKQTCLKLAPDLTEIFSKNRDYDYLSQLWWKWREVVGKKIRSLVPQMVELKNKMAQLNGFSDYGEQLRAKYETDGFEATVRRLNAQVAPLYRLVQAYVRDQLQETYNDTVIPSDGMLPASVLGDMWGRMWTEIYDIVEPYPNMTSMDRTPQMVQQNYTVRHMYDITDEFYTSMGLKPMPRLFYNRSMLERPKGREVECHATAWDFFDGEDFRIRMCTEVNFKDLETVHHEIGHVQYFMQYAHQPFVYRDGANDGFHEAIGELMGMTMASVSHLRHLGLLSETDTPHENSINYLMRTALKTVSTIPFHYVNDLWRWELYRGEIPQDSWNARYWELKKLHVGVQPPVDRTEEHLDIFNIFHVTHDYDMIRYFTRTILQFQFAEALCDAAGYQGPLHDCDFSTSEAAGAKLAAMLSLGASRHWKDAMEQLTGTRDMDASAMLRYFAPLQQWLEDYVKERNLTVGWPGQSDDVLEGGEHVEEGDTERRHAGSGLGDDGALKLTREKDKGEKGSGEEDEKVVTDLEGESRSHRIISDGWDIR